MIFQHTIDRVLSGEKTLTSRLALPEPDGTKVVGCEMIGFPMGVPAVVRGSKDNSRWNIRWQVGKTYAVQPGRGKAAVARIRLLAIKRYDVREITVGEARCEGFINPRYFWELWIQMHDKPLWREIKGYDSPPYLYKMANRPAERYQAWQLRFEVVK